MSKVSDFFKQNNFGKNTYSCAWIQTSCQQSRKINKSSWVIRACACPKCGKTTLRERMFVPAWPSIQPQQFISSQWFMSFVYVTEVRFSVPSVSLEQQSCSLLQNGNCPLVPGPEAGICRCRPPAFLGSMAGKPALPQEQETGYRNFSQLWWMLVIFNEPAQWHILAAIFTKKPGPFAKMEIF